MWDERDERDERSEMRRNYERELQAVFEELGLWGVEVVGQYKPKPRDPHTGKVRLFAVDFAMPGARLAMEIDGFWGFDPLRGHGKGGRSARTVSGHRNWAGFHRDREKDRLLLMAGWRVMRYGPADLSSPLKVREAALEWLRVGGLDLEGGPE